MMSSAIPARLQFQCGHAALVTLPRVKGETTAQRNARIAHEKSSALARQCDFCGPTVAVAAASQADALNGGHMTAADVIAAEPVAAAAPTPVASEPVVEPEMVEPVASIEAEAPADAVAAEVEAPVEVVAPVLAVAPIQPVAAKHAASTNGAVARKPRKPRQVTPMPAVSPGYSFVVEYHLERVLQAVDIRDALRQAAALGASDVLAITRES